jgi:hypothetical protein
MYINVMLQTVTPEFVWGTEENHEKSQPGHLVTQLRLYTDNTQT